MPKGTKAIILGLLGAVALSGTASAGGFGRGTADTDILFEDGGFVMRSGVTYVAPQRGYETITSPLLGGTVTSTDDDYSDPYWVPSLGVKFGITDDLSCAGTYTEVYGAGATYGDMAVTAGLADGTGTASKQFTSREIGGTCGYKFDLAKGRAWVIGGVFGEDFKYSETVRLADNDSLSGGGVVDPHPFFYLGLGGDFAGEHSGTLSFNGEYELGYRVGLAYEIPEIALRAQLMYRSAVRHDPSGSFDFYETLTGNDLVAFDTLGHGMTPQSVELKVQSGIAPGWLAFGSVKWTDWSVVQTLDYTIDTSATPIMDVINTNLEYFWRDGWTVSGGVGHAFNDMLSGSVSLTWDKGVSTTEDTFTDTWTLGGGIAVASNENTQLRIGGAVSYLTSGSVIAEGTGATPNEGDTFAYTVGNDWSYAIGGNLKINF
mgnify:CR=1 FL=1